MNGADLWRAGAPWPASSLTQSPLKLVEIFSNIVSIVHKAEILEYIGE